MATGCTSKPRSAAPQGPSRTASAAYLGLPLVVSLSAARCRPPGERAVRFWARRPGDPSGVDAGVKQRWDLVWGHPEALTEPAVKKSPLVQMLIPLILVLMTI